MDKQQDKVFERNITRICNTIGIEGSADDRLDALADLAYIRISLHSMYEALIAMQRQFLQHNTDLSDPWAKEAMDKVNAALSKANPNSKLTPSELRDKLDAVEVIGDVS